MKSDIIKGKLVTGSEALSASRLRKRKSEVFKIDQTAVPEYEKQGYEVEKIYKSGVRVTRPLQEWQLFENDVWLLLYQFGFECLNKDSQFMMNIARKGDPLWKQIDVFAKDQDTVFVVECKHAQELQKKSLQQGIAELIANQSSIELAVKKLFEDRALKVSFILATKNIIWSEADKKRIENAKKPILVWDEEFISYLQDLSKLSDSIGSAARYQLYSLLFPNRKTFVLENQNVPAIKGKAGKWTYYSFIAKPSQLLKICSVNRRVATSNVSGKDVREAVLSYQRMLQVSKIKQINKYIENGNFFPNSIIITFDREPDFSPAAKTLSDFQLGHLELPNKYSSAWVLDGQHRLYGYANTSRVDSAPLPVIAFVKLPVVEQGKLFVEINQYQTSVNRNLLWDLAGDIFIGSDDPTQIEELTISNCVKLLNTDKKSPLKGLIKIPSHSVSRSANVTMTTLCGSLKKHQLVMSSDFFGRNYDGKNQEGFEEFVAQRLEVYFGVIKKLFPGDWSSGDNGYLRSNNGIAGMILVLKQLLLYLNFQEDQNKYMSSNIETLENEISRILKPGIDYLREDDDRSETFRQRRGVAGQVECALEICQKIKDQIPEFPLPKVRSQIRIPLLPKDKTQAKDLDYNKAIDSTEIKLRTLVIDVLIDAYAENWFIKGLPPSIRESIENKVQARIKDFPYLRTELMQSLDKKMEYSYVGDLLDIIVSRSNWTHFEEIFGKKANFEAHLRDFIVLRNDKAHPKDIDQVVWDKGLGAIGWINRCIDTYNKKAEVDE